MNLKRVAVDQLAAYLQAQVPSLPVLPNAAEEEERAQFPVLRVVPGRFSFVPFQEADEFTIDSSTQIVDLGSFEGSIVLELAGRNPFEREELEQPVLDAFFQLEGQPGLVMAQSPAMTIGGRVTLYSTPISYELSREEWSEELVFSKKLRSSLTVETRWKALALRTAYDIAEMISALGASVAETTDGNDVVLLDPLNPTTALPSLEEGEVQDDGSTDLPV